MFAIFARLRCWCVQGRGLSEPSCELVALFVRCRFVFFGQSFVGQTTKLSLFVEAVTGFNICLRTGSTSSGGMEQVVSILSQSIRFKQGSGRKIWKNDVLAMGGSIVHFARGT